MLRGWGELPSNPFDDDDNKNDDESPKTENTDSSTQKSNVASNDTTNSNPFSTQTTTTPSTPATAAAGSSASAIVVPPAPSYDPPAVVKAQDPGLFREWEAANKRYQEEKVEITTEAEDPMASSPGNSSCAESLAGWSVGPGLLVDRTTANIHQFDVESCVDDDDDDDDDASDSSVVVRNELNERSSSPREGRTAKHSLSMVKEEDNADEDTSKFDEVDLEAFSKRNNGNISNINNDDNDNSTNKKDAHYAEMKVTRKASSDDNDLLRRRKNIQFSIANRALQEFHSNPKLKFRVVSIFSMMLVASILIVISIVTSRGGSDRTSMNDESKAADATALLELLGADTPAPITPSPTTEAPSGNPFSTPSVDPSDAPTTASPTSPPSNSPSYAPTSYPTEVPTSVPTTSSPTDIPTDAPTTAEPSFSPTTPVPTFLPSERPATMTPTRDCADDEGTFETWNGKFRDCAWLDNEYNGATSARKDLNCLDSALGDACKYTCRLYNGCMNYLLSSLPEYTLDNDISIGNRCDDKEGSYLSNGNVPRKCAWLEENADTAPMKKNLNCGTPDVPRTELGVMCPASCAGYNDCVVGFWPLGGSSTGGSSSSSGSGSGGVKDIDLSKVPPSLLSLLDIPTNFHETYDDGEDEDEDKETRDDQQDGSDTLSPTSYPTYGPPDAEERCRDRDGDFINHMGNRRSCRWFNRDDVDEKKRLNCGITEIGLNCMESCPCESGRAERTGFSDTPAPTSFPTSFPTYWLSDTPTTIEEGCRDRDGMFLNHMNRPRKCRWLNLDDVDERKRLNCGITEIGLNCMESCPCESGMAEQIIGLRGAGTTTSVTEESSNDESWKDESSSDVSSNQSWKDESSYDESSNDGSSNDGSSNQSSNDKSSKEKSSNDVSSNQSWKDESSKDESSNDVSPNQSWKDESSYDESPNDGSSNQSSNDKSSNGESSNDNSSNEEPLNDEPSNDESSNDSAPLDVIMNIAATSEEPTPSPSTAPTPSPSIAPTPHPANKGVFDESGEVFTLTPLADASISEKDEYENFSTSKRLNVANNNGYQRQSMLLFDLTFAARSFGPIIGEATLRLYSVTGGDSHGGVTMRKMTYTNWTEDTVTWANLPGGDELGDDEPIISFVDGLESNTWYDIDVTAAVRDALENHEPRLGIRIVSSEDDTEVFYFGSKEREKEPPALVVRWRTFAPSPRPTNAPTQSPTASPTVSLDCMDKKGTFVTHTGEHQPCSWLSTGNGSIKKDFNCGQDQTHDGNAAMFCQAQCSAYNGCDDLHCRDMSGTYMTHTGWTAQCSWLKTGQGKLKLDQNCGGDGVEGDDSMTELGRRCQKTCGDYNGCNAS